MIDIKFTIDSQACDIHKYKNKNKAFNFNVNIFFNVQDIKRYLIPRYFTLEAPNVSAAGRYITKTKEASASTPRNNFRLNSINYETKTRLKTEYTQNDYVENINKRRVGTSFENFVLRNLLCVTLDVNTKHKYPP